MVIANTVQRSFEPRYFTSGSTACRTGHLVGSGFQSEEGHTEKDERQGDDGQATLKPSIGDDKTSDTKKKYRDREGCRALENRFIQEKPAAKPGGHNEQAPKREKPTSNLEEVFLP
jgi:hypothetical protein